MSATQTGPPGPDADDRLAEALREYQAALDANRRPSRHELLTRYADVADELADCLDGLDLMRAVAPQLGTAEHRSQPEPVSPGESRLGDFRLLREIGRGGMGVVYEAVQISLGRHVALKVLPLAGTFDGRQLQRFENEARAAAHLHHSNIVPVFAVGRERGVPYYAMQLIDGHSLAALLDALRQTPASAPPGVDTAANAASLTHQTAGSPGYFRAVARVGVQVAEALEYAHQIGVVHRDVKPANLLLDPHGKVWVADFGLARFQESPGMTLPGDLVGTLRYASPEQAAGLPGTDPRTDVYGLGVTLYELLTLRPAVTGTDRHQCLRQVLEQEPTPPRWIARAVPAELETVVLKAMAKAPEDRYASAGEMAADLQRFLDDRPIRARPPGLAERAARWARRNHRPVAAAALALAAAVVILTVTVWRVGQAEWQATLANRQLMEEKERTREAYETLKLQQSQLAAALREEADQHTRAEENLRQAREVLDYLNRLGVEEMDGRPEWQPLRRQLLARLIDYYQGFIDRHRDDPGVADELTRAQLQVAELFDEVGRKADALAAYQRTLPADPAPPDKVSPRPGPPPRGIAVLFLLGQSAVRRELKLSSDQRARVHALLDFGGRPPSNSEAAAAAMGLVVVLNTGQRERLEQIIRQQRGVRALLDPDVAGKLALSDSQKERIQAALHVGRPPWVRGWRPGGSQKESAQKGQAPKGTGSSDGSAEGALRVLDPGQRTTWAGLLGAPFHLDVRASTSAPPRPRPRGTTSYSYYEGQWRQLPDFDRLTPLATGVGPAFSLEPAYRGESYAFRFEGQFRLDVDEECLFILSSDDGARLFVDGKRVVDNDGIHPARTNEGRVRLARGTHTVVVLFFQATGDASLVVDLTTPRLGRRNLGDLVLPKTEDLNGPRRAR